jgi:hypothetical protein
MSDLNERLFIFSASQASALWAALEWQFASLPFVDISRCFA